MNKRRLCLLLALALCACALAGCAQSEEAPARPAYEPEEDWGTLPSGRKVTAPLNFLSLDGKRLAVEMREVTVESGHMVAEAVLQAFLDGPESEDLKKILRNIELVSVEVSGRVANVELSTQFAGYDAGEMLTARAALANTLCDLLDIDYVNVYVDGKDPGYEGKPLGAIKKVDVNLSLYLDQIRQEMNQIDTDDSYTEQRVITLYLPDPSGKYLTATAKEAQIRLRQMDDGYDRDYISTVLYELFQSAPELFVGTTISGAPMAVLDGAGGKIIALALTEEPENPYLAYGAIVTSLMGFVPECNGVRVSLYNGQETVLVQSAGGVEFENGLMRRSDFSGLIGNNIRLCLPRPEGSDLVTVSRTVPQDEAENPVRILRELMKAEPEEGLVNPFPEGTEETELLDAKLCGRTAVLDFSASFAGRCASMTAAEQYALVYAIVNTMTEIHGISRVQFLREGESFGPLGQLDLSGPILRNPGLNAPSN